ncbi:MAG: NTP transferase domain-containing protein [Berryella intestinalis]|uniref:NTP transferase domain-containing protein n=1 Tax=Berryella intestinalis TaxID=1531429 RepID=UPI002A5241CD|nr:NTP transferase domain-containing protein [Berryella intestinalis]MDD7369380.1 NTP transferase domain-containing protein [Berryella intestinalis]MDY3128773.1 NTP transferase domain-containing protein [Berryella intestinalis]
MEEALDALVDMGYTDESGLTDRAQEYLGHHKIDNAIILAAGKSTRFVPLNFEKPKGLLEVKGERLIERQIRQLREKGIDEIIVVVGYMKEAFSYLEDEFGVTLVESDDFDVRNNYASVYAAREYLGSTIVTSSDLYFSENLFQAYAYDAYYCTVYVPGKTPERGIITDDDDRILSTMYGDKCYDTWVTLGYAYFNRRFSENFKSIVEPIYSLPETANKFWADIQDDNYGQLYMYAKRCDAESIHEFDSLEELRLFDEKYVDGSDSYIMRQISHMLAVKESEITQLQYLKQFETGAFRFTCRNNTYICTTKPGNEERLSYQGRVYYSCSDYKTGYVRLYKMDKNIELRGRTAVDTAAVLDELYDLSEDFDSYHARALPLCAAENVISPFANLPLGFGFQERYIMNNTYSFNMDDNFVGCEKLYPFYQKLSEVCERVFGAKYTDARPFTGMHCIDMIVKTVCKPGEKMMILDKAHGGHASVKPVVERLGVEVYSAPYDLEENDLDYDTLNKMVVDEGIGYVLLAPSDLIRPLNVERIDTENCVLMWDCSQLMGLIAAGLVDNPLRTMSNIIMFGGTHKTFPGPASGLIMTNEQHLHELMEPNINPKFLRHSQMHQKISLLFALVEFEKYGAAYMSHMVHCSNYLGEKLRAMGHDVADIHGHISRTHQIFIRCSKEEMETIYDNAYKCEVTLNKKHKDLFHGYGIRLGTQEIARFDWDDSALDTIASIVDMLSIKNVDVEAVRALVHSLPEKKIHFAFDGEELDRFKKLMLR